MPHTNAPSKRWSQRLDTDICKPLPKTPKEHSPEAVSTGMSRQPSSMSHTHPHPLTAMRDMPSPCAVNRMRALPEPPSMERSYSIPVSTQKELERQHRLTQMLPAKSRSLDTGIQAHELATALHKLPLASPIMKTAEERDKEYGWQVCPRDCWWLYGWPTSGNGMTLSEAKYRVTECSTPSMMDDTDSVSTHSCATWSRKHSSWTAPPRHVDILIERPHSTKPAGAEVVPIHRLAPEPPVSVDVPGLGAIQAPTEVLSTQYAEDVLSPCTPLHADTLAHMSQQTVLPAVVASDMEPLLTMAEPIPRTCRPFYVHPDHVF